MPTKQRHCLLARLAIVAWLCSSTAHAETSAQDLDRLGKDLTPTGAEMAGNADGSIPAWDGGITKAPADFDPNKGYTNPLASEQPLYTITSENFAQYEQLLAPGQIEMLKRYPSYKMKVYPSHRTLALPQEEYDNIKAEAPGIQAVPGGRGLRNLRKSTVPFPVPKDGLEVVFNHEYRNIGSSFQREFVIFPVQSSGSFTPIKWFESRTYGKVLPDSPPSIVVYYLQRTLSPSNVAGEAVLLHEVFDNSAETRKTWTYNPGQRRVLRAPDVGYDTPQFNSDGLATIDSFEMFNGVPDRFDFKLVGKKEMIISYNNYDLTSKSLKYTDIVQQNHLNQELPRYEKHRVWVVEATVKPGMRHVYAKRVLYIDEDTWQIAHGDLYDGRDSLWRAQENHSVNFYDVSIISTAAQVDYDLQARRAFVMFLANEEKPVKYDKRPRSFYTQENLRRTSN
ncbi:hypothetical protein D9M68_169650 [compost metagenome]